jgi:hypothetical protein
LVVELGLRRRKDTGVAFDHDRVRALHARLVAGNPVASAELAELVLPEVALRLARRWPRTRGTDQVHDAVVEVFVQYVRSPNRYDPVRSSLVGWLQMQAHADLTNDYRSPARSFHQQRVSLIPSDAVAKSQSVRKLGLVSTDTYPVEEDHEVLDQVMEAVADPVDRRLLALIVDGDTSTAAAAEVLGIGDRPVGDQQRLVKQNKDRVKTQVKRLLRSNQ